MMGDGRDYGPTAALITLTLSEARMTELTVLQDCNTIQLTQGMNTLVDAQDCPDLSRWRWRAHRGGRGGGYYALSGREKSVQHMHRLILEASVGPCPPGMLTRHLNGDPLDNRSANLAWGTHAENHADSVRHGTATCSAPSHLERLRAYNRSPGGRKQSSICNSGERHPQAKLSRLQVEIGRVAVAAGPRGTASTLAQAWGVTLQGLLDAVKGKSWAV